MFYSSLENRINELREQQNSGQNINVQSSIINSFILADDILKSITDM